MSYFVTFPRFAKAFVMLLVIALIGCSPVASSTPVALASTSTPLPASTATLVPTNTPTPPTGKIMIVMNEELMIYPADGTDGDTYKNFLIPRDEFNKAFPIVGTDGSPVVSSYLSPDGNSMAVVTCKIVGYSCENYRLYISTIDLKTKAEITTYHGGLLVWSPSSDKVLIQGIKNASDKQVISARTEDFGAVLQLPPADAAFWTYDGKQIYFYKEGWHVINSNGANEQSIPCELCKLAPTPTSFAVAQSPDGKNIAIGYMDGTVLVVNSNNFSDFKMGSAGGYISRLFWSPDSTKLGINIDTTSSQSDVVIMSREGTIIEKVTHSNDVKFPIMCGWSPDSQYVDYLTIQEKGFDLFLHKIGEQISIPRLSIETSSQNCPIWLN